MTELQPMERFVWVDIETSGLDVEVEQIFEVGFRITDLDFEPVDMFTIQIWSDTHRIAAEGASDYVKEMHEKNSLWKDAKEYGVTPAVASMRMRKWLDEHEIGKDDPMCGSTVSFDRGFIKYHYPQIEERFSYRDINVSTVKELCRRFNPEMYESLDEDTKPLKQHRVQACLLDTVNEAAWYKENFLWVV